MKHTKNILLTSTIFLLACDLNFDVDSDIKVDEINVDVPVDTPPSPKQKDQNTSSDEGDDDSSVDDEEEGDENTKVPTPHLPQPDNSNEDSSEDDDEEENSPTSEPDSLDPESRKIPIPDESNTSSNQMPDESYCVMNSENARILLDPLNLEDKDFKLKIWLRKNANFDFSNIEGELSPSIMLSNSNYATNAIRLEMVDNMNKVNFRSYGNSCPCGKGSGNATLTSPDLNEEWHEIIVSRIGNIAEMQFDGEIVDGDEINTLVLPLSNVSVGNAPGYSNYYSAPVDIGELTVEIDGEIVLDLESDIESGSVYDMYDVSMVQ